MKLRISAHFPILILLFICLIYFAFPSFNFNNDALHYNILNFSCIDKGLKQLLRDESTPAHFLWHLLNALITIAIKPANILQSLYILRAFNIVIALIYIFLFWRFLKKFCDGRIAISLTFLHAFSNACLQYFLSLEVYALNNIFVLIYLRQIYKFCCLTRGGYSNIKTTDIFIITISAFTAVLTHITNFLLIFATALFFLLGKYEIKFKIRISALFIIFTTVILQIYFVVVSTVSGLSLQSTIFYIFNYASKTGTYINSFNPLANLWLFIKLFPRLFFDKYGAIPVYFAAGIVLIIIIRNFKILAGDNFFRFILIYFIVNLIFFSYWDTRENLKLKIIFIQLSLITVNYLFFKLKFEFSKLLIITTVFVCFLIFSLNFYYTVIVNSNLDNISDYKFAEQINNFAQENKIAIKNISNYRMKFFALTYFNKTIEFLDESAPDYRERFERYSKTGYKIITAQ